MKTYTLQAFENDDLVYTSKEKYSDLNKAKRCASTLWKLFPNAELIIKDSFLMVAIRKPNSSWHTF